MFKIQINSKLAEEIQAREKRIAEMSKDYREKTLPTLYKAQEDNLIATYKALQASIDTIQMNKLRTDMKIETIKEDLRTTTESNIKTSGHSTELHNNYEQALKQVTGNPILDLPETSTTDLSNNLLDSLQNKIIKYENIDHKIIDSYLISKEENVPCVKFESIDKQDIKNFSSVHIIAESQTILIPLGVTTDLA